MQIEHAIKFPKGYRSLFKFHADSELGLTCKITVNWTICVQTRNKISTQAKNTGFRFLLSSFLFFFLRSVTNRCLGSIAHGFIVVKS